jgi:hypothetical protein
MTVMELKREKGFASRPATTIAHLAVLFPASTCPITTSDMCTLSLPMADWLLLTSHDPSLCVTAQLKYTSHSVQGCGLGGLEVSVCWAHAASCFVISAHQLVADVHHDTQGA